MSILEEKIKKNRDLLDGAEPSEGHLDRFLDKLSALHSGESEKVNRFPGKYWKVAAVAAILIGLSVTLYIINPSKNPGQLNASALPQEIRDAKIYYNNLAEEKLVKISECAVSASEASYIQKTALEQISLLDSNSVKLESELQKDQNNERLVNALIRNYKTKADLLNDILNRLCHI